MKFVDAPANHNRTRIILRRVLHKRPEIRPKLIASIADQLAIWQLIVLIKITAPNVLNENYLAIKVSTAKGETRKTSRLLKLTA